MKKSVLFLLALLFAFSMQAQSPDLFNYQGVARDASGNPLVSQSISLKFTIRSDSATGPAEYAETHSITTNSLGLFSIQIGSGSVVSGSISAIEWGKDDFFLEVEMDETGGSSYTSMGTSQLVSVPFAMHANHADLYMGELKNVDTSALADGQLLAWNQATGTWIPVSASSGGHWEVSLNDPNSIDYLDGNVGIGTEPSSSDALLTVKDSVASTKSTVDISRGIYGPGLVLMNSGLGIGVDRPDTIAALTLVDSGVNKRHGLKATKPASVDTLSTAQIENHAKGDGLIVIKSGAKGTAAFLFSDSDTKDAGLEVAQLGLGPAIKVHNSPMSPSGSANGVHIVNNSKGLGLLVDHATDTNSAARFFNGHPLNKSTVVKIEQAGMGIAQEVVAGNPSNDTVAQLVVHGGQGPVSMFHAMNPTNEHTALSAAHEGLGSVAFFNNNPLAAAPAVIIENKGNTEGLKVVNAGDTAVAASFSSLHTAGTEPVMEIVQQGKKHAIFMRVKNTTNSEPMVFGQSDGLGGLLDMELTSIVNTAAGIQITHAGYGIGGSFTQTGHGTALRGFKTGGGTGRCGEFINDDTTNFDDGVLIQTNTSTTGAFALHANNTGPGKGALLSGGAHTGGDHSISGLLSKGGGTFKIDHPHDPENKYLYHSFVESPDMMNVYNGNVVLNSNGKAVIQMPAWFEDLNKEFRYQLTCIGGYANVYVSQEMSGGQFEIAGGKQGLKVSWQVTGIRKDKFADANRVQVEAEKPEYEKGTYLHPEAWGQDKSRGLDYKLQRDHGLQK